MPRFEFSRIGGAAAAIAMLGLAAGCASPNGEMGREMTFAEALPEYDRTGETRTCLNLRRIDTIDPVTERLWLVETIGGDVYLNDVGRGCGEADSSFTYLQYDAPTGQLCRGEIVRVFNNSSNTQVGSCGLGDFERLELLEK